VAIPTSDDDQLTPVESVPPEAFRTVAERSAVSPRETRDADPGVTVTDAGSASFPVPVGESPHPHARRDTVRAATEARNARVLRLVVFMIPPPG